MTAILSPRLASLAGRPPNSNSVTLKVPATLSLLSAGNLFAQCSAATQLSNGERPGNIDWGPNDFDVFEGDRCIGRIFLSPASPPDCNWMWTITDRYYPPSIHSHDYSATREQAMADFKAQWTGGA